MRLHIIAFILAALTFLSSLPTARAESPVSWTPEIQGYPATHGTSMQSVGSLSNLSADDGATWDVIAADVGIDYVATLYPVSDIVKEWKTGGVGIGNCAITTVYGCLDDAITEASPGGYDTTTFITTAGYISDKVAQFAMGNLTLPENSWIWSVRLIYVAKQNESTSYPQWLRFEIVNPNGTTCYFRDTVSVATSSFAFWLLTLSNLCRNNAWAIAWTSSIINAASMRITWLSPYFHTVTLTAFAWSVRYHQSVSGVQFRLTYPSGTRTELQYSCIDGADTTELYVVSGGMGILVDANMCDGATVGVDLSGSNPDFPVELIIQNGLGTTSNTTISFDVANLGVIHPSLPSAIGLQWIFLIALVITTAIYLSYKFSVWWNE